MAKKYRVTNPLISVRVSTDAKSPDYEEFVNYADGEVIDLATAPKHIDIKGLLEMGAVEEVKDG